MILTTNEIVFLTSVSKGRKPLGVTYTLPSDGNRIRYMEETMEMLKEKKILDEQQKLTTDGLYLLRFWEGYRNGKNHFSINNTYFMPVNKKYMLMLEKRNEQYFFQCISPELILFELLRQSEGLRQGEETPIRGKWFDLEEWENDIDQLSEIIMFREYYYGKIKEEKAYAFKGSQGYIINLKQKRAREISTGWMRKQIFQEITGSGGAEE